MHDRSDTRRDPQSELRLLSEITQKINLGNSLDEVLDLVFKRVRDFLPYNRVAVALADPQGQTLEVHAVRCDGEIVLATGYSGPIAGSSLAPLLREGRIRVINDLEAYLAQKPESDATRRIVLEGMKSSLTLPLLIEGRPVGVVFFSSRERNSYRPEHEALLLHLAGHLSIAVERSRLIGALRERTRNLESVLQNSADAIVVTDAEDVIVTWSDGAERIFGYTAAEVIGHPFRMLMFDESTRSGEYDALLARLRRDGFVKDHETVRRSREQRRVAVNETATLVRDDRGRLLGRSCIMRDVTHLKRLQEELVRSRSLAVVGELAATVAHEIKNPLAGISGAVQVLEDAIPVTDSRREVVGEILGQIRRLDKTVRDLLAFARPMTPARSEIDLRETLMRAWSLLAQQPGTSGIRFIFEGDGDMKITADSDLLHQVWLNLLQNAVEVMPRGGELRVTVTEGELVQIAVSDTGPGIDPAHRERLFRPFFTTKTRGTGLGLAISRKIIEAHGGTIRIDSAPQHGTTILMELPR